MPSVNVTFYPYFEKQPNSTKRPDDDQGILQYAVTFSCKMWEGCSFMSPTIELNLSNGVTFSNPYQWKYCYIQELHRYYHIFDWKFATSLWIATLQVDVLASFKDNIGAAWVFADRVADRKDESGNVIDTGLLDDMIPTMIKPKIYKETVTLTHLHGGSFYAGTYVVGIINADDGAVGAVSYYAMDNRNFRRLMSAMLSGSYLGSADINRETQKAILNPFQYVANCNWFPFTIEQVTGNATPTMLDNLRLGWWTMPSAANGGPNYYNISTYGRYETLHQFKMWDHPLTARLNMKMWNYEPYTQYEFTCPYFGNFTITRSQIPDGKATALFSYDLVSGLCQLRIYDGQVDTTLYPDESEQIAQTIARCKLVRTLSGQVACPIQIAQTTSDYGAAKVTQVQASATVLGNSAALQRQYTSAHNAQLMANAQSVGGATNMLGSALSLNFSGIAAGFSQMVQGEAANRAAFNDWWTTYKYDRPATNAANYAARTSATHTSAKQRAPVVETSGNNGSNLEARFPFEQRCSFLLPTTITGDPYATIYDITDDMLVETKNYYNWVGYPHGRTIRINRHSGFVQGHDPRMTSITANETELDAIKDFISNGIFYE